MAKAPNSKMSQLEYDAAKILADFRAEVGFARFGLVVQALYAHVLLRLGAEVLDIKNPGHPDICAVIAGVQYNFEIETAQRKTLPRQLDDRDLKVLRGLPEGELGYFCVLESGPPIAWLCVDIAALGIRAERELYFSLLRSYSNDELSSDCTVEFARLVIQQNAVLHRLTYDRLRHEALDGKPR